MENSFFEFRNETMDVSMRSACDSDEVIDNSMEEQSFLQRKPALKNQTVAESEDSADDEDEEDSDLEMNREPFLRQRNIVRESSTSSEDDIMTRNSGSTRRQSNSSSFKQKTTSGIDNAISPELIPRRPPFTPKFTNSPKYPDSPIMRRRGRKIMTVQSESETDEPSVKQEDNEASDEQDNFDEYEMTASAATRMSIMGVRPKDMDSDESDLIQSDESDMTKSSNNDLHVAGSTESLTDLPDVDIKSSATPRKPPDIDEVNTSKISCSSFESSDHDVSMEFNNPMTKDNVLKKNLEKVENSVTNEVMQNFNNSVHDISMELNNSMKVKETELKSNRSTVHNSSAKIATALIDLTNRLPVEDDEVTVILDKNEVINISSDEDCDLTVENESRRASKKSPNVEKTSPRASKKSPNVEKTSPRASKKSPKVDIFPIIKKSPTTDIVNTAAVPKDGTMKQYLLPPSYPNQGVVYVKKQVRDNEMRKLESLKEDLHNVRYLLQNMDKKTLPDGGAKLVTRLNKLEGDVKRQAEAVAAMVVEPDNPTAEDITKDGFGFKNEKGLSWDDIQAASNQVQPRMFGKQAMSTHLAERSLILDRLRDLHESLASRPAETALAPQPAPLRTPLMPHQLHALLWLQWRETQKPRGGILADDMGLGKTITMISLVLTSNTKMDDDDNGRDKWRGKENSKLVTGGTLVVCPASLLQQWSSEVTKHCRSGSLSVSLHHGAARPTQPHRVAGTDLVLTTYNILQRDCEKNGVLMKIRWSRIILDEAHIVRNHKSATSVAVSALHGDRRWCLTGTPVQNKDLDVFALLKFLRCTPFDDLTMWKKWIDNKSLGGQERMSTIMRCLLLRRTKHQLQQRGQLECLPERTLHQVNVTLTKDELNVYHKVLVFSKTLFAQFLHQRAEKQADSTGLTAKNDAFSKMHKKMVALQGAKPVKSHEILVLLLRLRQLCCHCGLISSMLDDTDQEDVVEDVGGLDLLSELNKLTLEDQNASRRKSERRDDEPVEDHEEGTTVAEAIRTVLSPNNPVFNLNRNSSKITSVLECLNNNVFCNQGDKAVVVSQWTSVLRLVERELVAAGVRCVTLSGQVPVPHRANIVDTYNDNHSSIQVMLLSLCAGGVGLNLCGGNHLLLLDPHWNPQLEQQAQDRIYRVGQKKDVHIYRFMCTDTVEQSIRKLQEAKLEVAESVLTGARHTNASKLTIEDLKMLFNMGQT